jgi:hypothetical protein
MGVDDYKRQQDLLFQQMEEKAKLAVQAKNATITHVMKVSAYERHWQPLASMLSRWKRTSERERRNFKKTDTFTNF